MPESIEERTERELTRRRFLGVLAGGVAAAAGSGVLSACGSSSGGGGGGGASSLAMSTWDIPTDIKSYKSIAAKYQQANKGTKVDVQVTPGGDFDAWISARLAADKAPPVLRWTYQDIGRYAQQGGFVDLSKYLPSGYENQFLPGYWAAVAQNGGVFGIPQHTDGWGIYVDNQIMDKIGAKVPESMSDAWTWDEFMQIARDAKKATGKYAFSFFFSGPGTGWRWLPILYMHGGSLLQDDLKTPAIDSPEGVEAIAWCQNWYKEQLIPPSNSIKGSQIDTANTFFVQHRVGMMISSDFNMAGLKGQLPEDRWSATYLFRDAKAATNMGGNALVVTKSADDEESAAKFVQFVCNPDNMKYFCDQSLFVPVRKDLVGKNLDWVFRPDLMKRFSEQAAVLSPEMAKLQSLPQFGAIAQVLTDQLDLCWSGQQAPQATAKSIADGVKRALAA